MCRQFRIWHLWILPVACLAGCQSDGPSSSWTLLKVPATLAGVPPQHEPDLEEAFDSETREPPP
jgi:hypothetical protein